MSVWDFDPDREPDFCAECGDEMPAGGAYYCQVCADWLDSLENSGPTEWEDDLGTHEGMLDEAYGL